MRLFGRAASRDLDLAMALILALSPLTARSQQRPSDAGTPPLPLNGLAGATDLGGGEDRTTTIDKCLRDLASDDVGARLRAVMILGKYPDDPRARAALIGALTDNEVRIRRAAVVSIGENEIFIPQAAAALLKTLGDEDVEVRRLTSSMLPRIVMSMPIARSGNTSLTGAAFTRSFPDGTRRLIIAAFTDDDSVVRRNMLGNESLLRNLVDASVVKPLLHDAVAETRALAVAALALRLPAEEFVETAKVLTRDEDPHVRQALARSLSRVRSPGAAGTLKQLLADPEPAVAAAAAEGLFLMQQPIARDQLLKLLESSDIDSNLAVRLISYYPIVDRDSRNAILALTNHERSDFRAAALSSMARVRGEWALDSSSALPFLQDPSHDVRRGAQQILYANHDLTAEQLMGLISSPFVDVRQFVLSASRTVGRDAAKQILYELLLDESTPVRRQVITEFARQRFPDAVDILAASLDDDSNEIKQAALTGLFQLATDDSVKILQQFARETENDDLRAMVLSVLAHRARLNQASPAQPSPRSPPQP